MQAFLKTSPSKQVQRSVTWLHAKVKEIQKEKSFMQRSFKETLENGETGVSAQPTALWERTMGKKEGKEILRLTPHMSQMSKFSLAMVIAVQVSS